MAKRRKRNKKWISRLFFLMLLIVAVVMCYLVYEAYFKDKKDVPKKGEDKVKVVQPVEEKDETPEEEVVQKEEVVQYEGENPNNGGTLTGVITYLGISGDNLVARVNIDQYLSDGNCEINIVKDGAIIYNDTAPVIDSASTSTCEGFNIPLNKLTTGTVRVDINVTSGDRGGVISREISL